MRHFNLILTFLGLCCLPLVSGYAFFDKDVHLLTMQDGLADNTVSSIYKDKDGFIWFGTNNGLSRYDGKTIKNFGAERAYMNVAEIMEISDHCLGVVADGALLCFDRKAERFIPVMLASDSSRIQARRLLPADDGSFWVLHRERLVLYRQTEIRDAEARLMSIVAKPEKEFNRLLGSGELFSAFCYSPDRQTLFLVSDRGNLLLFNPRAPLEMKKIRLFDDKRLTVNAILNSGGIIWISTVGDGIIRYHIASGHVDCITYGGEGKENLLSHTDVYQVIPISGKRYLAVTWSGYTLLIPDKEDTEQLTTEIYNNTMSQMYRNLETRMLAAYYDSNGVLWIGTNGGGVMYSDLRSQFFNQYHQKRHNEVCGIAMDSDRYLWLATFHQGIMKSNEPFDPMKRLHFSTVNAPVLKNRQTVLCVLQDWGENLWFGNSDGTLICYNEKSKRFTFYPLLPNGKANSSSVWALYMDKKNRIWVGTEQGLLLVNPASGDCRKVDIEKQLPGTPSVFIRAIAGTKDGAIWLGTSNAGVCKMIEKADGSFIVRNGYEERAKLASISVRSLLASSDGNLYVGYTDGFAVLSPSTEVIRDFYTTHDGLSSNFIGCMTEDGKGRIWLGSNSGVSRYSRHQHLFYNYYIAGSNRSAMFCNGMLFWGNNKSLTWFNPDAVDARANNGKVLITGLEVDNRSVAIGGVVNGQTILREGISYTDSLVLSNANRDFSLVFNNLSYSEEQQKYNYRLLPYQEHWLVSNDGEKASYTNLPEGEYTFEVKNIYPDGGSGDVTTLKIKILPHWSRTFLFRSFVLLVVLGIAAWLVRLVRIRQRRLEREMQMKHELLTVSMEREKEKQIRVERENFFTGAAHELRTPLTLILSPLQELLQQTKPTEPLYGKLLTMYKNGSSLHTLVDHLLYVQKIEAGMVKLQLSEVDVVCLVKEVCASFTQIAELKGFRFDVHLPGEAYLLWVDAEKIASAVRNLLSNAFKYTRPGGMVSLSVGRTAKDGKEYCRITVSDTGTGIPDELQGRIFDSFITGKNTPAFSSKMGIGLRIVKNTMDLHHGVVTLDSEAGRGSTFVLLIPEGKAHFASDDYETVDYRLNEAEVRNEEKLLLLQPVEEQEAETGGKKTVLIIEDNKDIREYVRSLFIQKYKVVEAADGEEGVRMATEKMPDLIISDVMMPVKDGFTCCREIRKHPSTAHIPILMLTAKAEDADVLQASRNGVDDYMMKPFNPEILKAKADNLILLRERLKRIYTKALMLKQEPADGELKDPFMEQLVHVVEANLSNENFSVKLLAEQLNMSQPTLYRKVKQRSELAVIDIIRSVRVSKAASLIMENRYSIQEISEMVGYTDARTLRKHFIEQFGVSPSRYMNI